MEFTGTAAQLSCASQFVPEQRSKKEVMLKHALGFVDTGNDSHSPHEIVFLISPYVPKLLSHFWIV